MVRNLRKIENHYYGASQEIIDRARALRKIMTPAEKELWTALRRKQLDGIRFRRQHPIGQFIVDFYCHQALLVIELDGEVHLEKAQSERDENRQYELENMGLKVIRFRNEEVLSDVDSVLDRISGEISDSS